VLDTLNSVSTILITELEAPSNKLKSVVKVLLLEIPNLLLPEGSSSTNVYLPVGRIDPV